MKSPVKKQRGNAFHRGWPQAKESYLNSSSLEVHRSQESFRTRSNDIYIFLLCEKGQFLKQSSLGLVFNMPKDLVLKTTNKLVFLKQCVIIVICNLSILAVCLFSFWYGRKQCVTLSSQF